MTQGIEFGDNGMPFEAPATAPAATPAPTEATEHPEGSLVEKAAQDAFAPPRGEWDYEFPMLEGASDAEVIAQSEMRIALFAEKIPSFAVNVALQVGGFNLKNGPLSDEGLESARVNGMAALERKHGAGAKDIIAKARAVLERLDKRNPALGDYLIDSGCASDPHVIETLARLS